MLNPTILQEAARTLGEAARPAKVILFGSHARGDAKDDSDADFLVIKPEVANPSEEMVRLYRAIRPLRLPVDILVYSRAEVERRRDWCSSAIYWALREGKVLYDSGIH